ncbi:MAG: ATP-dependent DNA helicase RecG [Maricaulaceae bacterium]
MRPAILFPLFAELSALKGVGPKTASLMAKLTGPLVRDLLFHAPSGLIDRSARPGVAQARDGEIASFLVQVERHFPPEQPRRPYRVRCREANGFLTLAWFHAKRDYLQRLLPVDAVRLVSGKVERFSGEIQILHPDYVLDPDGPETLPDREPVYPLTAGLSGKVLSKACAAALARLPALEEWQDPSLLAARSWPSFADAVARLHAPESAQDLDLNAPARARLAYDELLASQLALALARAFNKRQSGRPMTGDGAKVAAVKRAAGFTPTGAQSRAFAEIERDMAQPERMARLLQGDVGSGKTFVAALALARAVEAGRQAALMAPTEILARQHGETLKPWLQAAGIEAVVLTGRDKGKTREALLAAIASGQTDVVIGTHALFQETVDFADLGLVVIDEQHRFGVSDRLRLAGKGVRPDLLVMTATPIPRTLALAAYGDLDASKLDEKPPGRQPVVTRALPLDRMEEVLLAVGRAIDRGEQVFWVCPLVESSDVLDLSAVEDRYDALRAEFGDQVGLVHGRLSAQDKDAMARAFAGGDYKILVATTVIEVGVNVPAASIMIIEHADRFGLAQLHQLRGRVGRGDRKAACLLLYKAPLGEAARARLDILRRTEDGFLIAEEDWRLRGAGDLLGRRQSGIADHRFADLEAHADLLEIADTDARAVLSRDPTLQSARGAALRVLLYLFDRDQAVKLLKAG